jgi:hypothetical protein
VNGTNLVIKTLDKAEADPKHRHINVRRMDNISWRLAGGIGRWQSDSVFDRYK